MFDKGGGAAARPTFPVTLQSRPEVNLIYELLSLLEVY